MASSSYFLLKIKYSNNSLVVIHWETSGKGATLITIQLYGASLQDRVTDRKPNHIPTDELKQGDHKQVRQRKHHKTPLFGKLKHCETLLMAEKWQQGRRNKLKKKKKQTREARMLLNRHSSICAKMSCSPWGRGKTLHSDRSCRQRS